MTDTVCAKAYCGHYKIRHNGVDGDCIAPGCPCSSFSPEPKAIAEAWNDLKFVLQIHPDWGPKQTAAFHEAVTAMDDAVQALGQPPTATVMPSLLRKPKDAPGGCYCKPGQCGAPVIMGRQMACRDPEKARAL